MAKALNAHGKNTDMWVAACVIWVHSKGNLS